MVISNFSVRSSDKNSKVWFDNWIRAAPTSVQSYAETWDRNACCTGSEAATATKEMHALTSTLIAYGQTFPVDTRRLTCRPRRA